MGTIGFVEQKCGAHFHPIRKLCSSSSFGIRWSRSMNGGHKSLWCLFRSSVCVFSFFMFSFIIYIYIYISFPNTSVLVKHKFWECIQARCAWRWAMHTSFYMNYAWLGLVLMIVFSGNKLTLVKGFLKDWVWHLFVTLRCGQFRLSITIGCSTKNNGMKLMLDMLFGITSSCMSR